MRGIRSNLSAAIALGILLALAAPGIAQECVPITEDPEIDATTPFGRYYVDNDCIPHALCHGLPEQDLSIWVYEESNDVDGLQRNDSYAGDRSCGNADKVIL